MMSDKTMNDTLFLDRDGVVNVQLVGDYVKKPSEFVLRDDFVRAIPFLKQHFRRFILVTNQQCIGKGICTRADVDEVHRHMCQLLEREGFRFNAIYLCPHVAGSGCGCRKPETGMMQQALADFPDIDLSHSLMVGDSLTDMQFGRAAGLRTLYIGAVTPDNREAITAISDLISPTLLQYVQNL